MVKKIKIVDVEVTQNETEAQPTEVIEDPIVEEIKDEEVQPIEEEKPSKQPAAAKTVTCEFCNKEMLMKTYKYNHKLQCQEKHKPPPPPPPPTPQTSPEPKKKVKREVKPKEHKAEVPKVVESTKPTFNGVVSFNDGPRVDPYAALRQERLILQQRRVKSLISQAI